MVLRAAFAQLMVIKCTSSIYSTSNVMTRGVRIQILLNSVDFIRCMEAVGRVKSHRVHDGWEDQTVSHGTRV